MATPSNPVEYRRGLGIRPFSPWFETLTLAMYGLPLVREQLKLWDTMSGGRRLRPGKGWTEGFINAGRGSGKDDWLKSIVNHECKNGGHEIAGAPGQRLPFQVVCPLRHQAAGTMRMIEGEAKLPRERKHVLTTTRDSVEFTNGTSAIVQTCDDVAVVGDTVIGLAYNEWTLFPGDDSATPARVIESNHEPAMRRVVGAPPKRFLKAGSSYIKDGVAWQTFDEHFGNDASDILVVRGTTLECNPNTDREWLQAQYRKHKHLAPMHFESVWVDATFDNYFPGEDIQEAIQDGYQVIPWQRGTPVVIAADAAFSDKGDLFGWGVASSKPGRFDKVTRERGPRRVTVHECGAWKPDRDPREMARRLRDTVCRRYHTNRVIIDQHAARAFAVLCKDVGLHPIIVNWKAGEDKGSKVQRYRDFRTSMQSGDIFLPDNAVLKRDLYSCQSTLLPGGGERIQVPRTTRGHGDCLSAVVMAATTAAQRAGARTFLQALGEMTPEQRTKLVRQSSYVDIDLGDVETGAPTMSNSEWSRSPHRTKQ